MEREQRWLAAGVPDAAVRVGSIVDRYLVGTRLRLRRVETDEGAVLKLGQNDDRFSGGALAFADQSHVDALLTDARTARES